MWKNFLEKIIKAKHFILLIPWHILLLWFFYCERTVVAKHIIHCRLDNHIPFIKWFIIPYCIWYLYLAAGFLYLGFKSKDDFINLCIMIYAGHIACYIIYMLFPNGQNLRPEIVGNDILAYMIKRLYIVDTPTNVFPSLHVYDAVVVFMCSRSYLKENKKNVILAISFLVMIFASISTVFVKQHSVLDLLGGIVLAAVLYFIVSKCAGMIKSKTGQKDTAYPPDRVI